MASNLINIQLEHIYGYVIDGSTLGRDLDSWEDSALNGNDPFIIQDPSLGTPSGYENINSLETWSDHGSTVGSDYLVTKFQVRNITPDASSWGSLNNKEKDITLHYYTYPDATQAVIHLMTSYGMDMMTAQGYLTQQWHKHHFRVIESCSQRWQYSKLVVAQYLNFSEAEDLFDTIRNLIYSFEALGRFGIKYGDPMDGIMDYIWSENGYAGQGLRENGYSLNFGTFDTFIESLDDVLVKGRYTPYQDIYAKD